MGIRFPAKKIDEFQFFKKAARQLGHRGPEQMKAMVASLTPELQDRLRTVLHTKRVTIREAGGKTMVARRIIKARHILPKPEEKKSGDSHN